MYKEAEKAINSGLSLGARVVLGFASLSLGVMLILIDTPVEKAVYVYLFVCFCMLITVACIVKGRLRQFVGSLIGLGLFIISLFYLGSELAGGVFWSNSRGEPSVKNALLFLLAFGVPGITYTFRAKFGLRKP